MKNDLKKLLNGEYENHIFPFMWVHGEDEETIRTYMRAIHSANIGAVCVESRPHPDFAGPRWWHDMDIILDEARRMGMKVWILDDSHFPTGFANGGMMDAPEELCRQCLVYRTVDCPASGSELVLDMEECRKVTPFIPYNSGEQYDVEHRVKRIYTDDMLLGLVAVRKGGSLPDGIIDLSDQMGRSQLRFKVPDGEWKLYILHLTRNRGARRHLINMTLPDSCRILLREVHEKFWAHYADDFGKTIAGFFSDEPELGNGHLYETGKPIWLLEDQAWSSEVQKAVRERLGDNWVSLMPLIWDRDFDGKTAANVRLEYMDALTGLVEKNFSELVGGWCRDHGVKYIGHIIEDNNQHTRTGPSLGHYFRGLGGQDMSGIDVIGNQVFPQGEYDSDRRCGRFFHFVLGKLASSQAAIDPLKHGESMCEIFGACGWKEGLRWEKYLADHMLVRHVNHFVPHAFTLSKYPNGDCPPHFYCNGNDPMFRHFGKLMLYMNRICTLFDSASEVAETAVLYGAESDWMGRCMMPEDIAEPLARNQISFDIIPADVFTRPERYRTDLSDGLTVNGRCYTSLIIPECEFLAPCVADVIPALEAKGVRIIDAGKTDPSDIPAMLMRTGTEHAVLDPADRDVRVMHMAGDADAWMIVNEGAGKWTGSITLPSKGTCFAYDAWENGIRRLDHAQKDNATVLKLTLHPLHSLIVLFGFDAEGYGYLPEPFDGKTVSLDEGWKRSVCRAIDYPGFGTAETICLPDRLADEMPSFSGFVRYDKSISVEKMPGRAEIVIDDAYEGVELFVNGISCGMQIAPPFRYDITDKLRKGENSLRIEVATTLERENAGDKGADCPSGINGHCALVLSE